MNSASTSAKIDLLPNHVKEEILKALASELGFILYPASSTVVIFDREYIFARVSAPPRSTKVLWFPRTSNEKRHN